MHALTAACGDTPSISWIDQRTDHPNAMMIGRTGDQVAIRARQGGS